MRFKLGRVDTSRTVQKENLKQHLLKIPVQGMNAVLVQAYQAIAASTSQEEWLFYKALLKLMISVGQYQHTDILEVGPFTDAMSYCTKRTEDSSIEDPKLQELIIKEYLEKLNKKIEEFGEHIHFCLRKIKECEKINDLENLEKFKRHYKEIYDAINKIESIKNKVHKIGKICEENSENSFDEMMKQLLKLKTSAAGYGDDVEIFSRYTHQAVESASAKFALEELEKMTTSLPPLHSSQENKEMIATAFFNLGGITDPLRLVSAAESVYSAWGIGEEAKSGGERFLAYIKENPKDIFWKTFGVATLPLTFVFGPPAFMASMYFLGVTGSMQDLLDTAEKLISSDKIGKIEKIFREMEDFQKRMKKNMEKEVHDLLDEKKLHTNKRVQFEKGLAQVEILLSADKAVIEKQYQRIERDISRTPIYIGDYVRKEMVILSKIAKEKCLGDEDFSTALNGAGRLMEYRKILMMLGEKYQDPGDLASFLLDLLKDKTLDAKTLEANIIEKVKEHQEIDQFVEKFMKLHHQFQERLQVADYIRKEMSILSKILKVERISNRNYAVALLQESMAVSKLSQKVWVALGEKFKLPGNLAEFLLNFFRDQSASPRALHGKVMRKLKEALGNSFNPQAIEAFAQNFQEIQQKFQAARQEFRQSIWVQPKTKSTEVSSSELTCRSLDLI